MIEIVYYTDPLCSWSWAFEPQWRRLRYEFAGQLRWRYVMGGLIADWQRFSDPLNAVERPAQMGPQWYAIRQSTGVPLDERIWHEDPPSSSYPACVAYHAAARQGAEQGERYLRALREAAMLDRRNIARREVLLALAQELAASGAAPFDAGQLQRDLDDPQVRDAFRRDLSDAAYRDIGRFPALTIHGDVEPGIIIVGYRPYDVLRAALARVAPGRTPTRTAADIGAYVAAWGEVLAQEVAVALDRPAEEATRMLEAAVASGDLVAAEEAPGRYRQRQSREAACAP